MPHPRTTRTRRTPATRPRRPVVITALAALCVAGVLGTWAVSSGVGREEGPVAVIGDQDITADEIRFQMGLLASGVDNAVTTGRLAAEDRDPELRQRALDAALRDAQLLQLGRDAGIIDFTGFAGFQRELAAENASRAAALAAGEVVYGTTGFSAEEFHARIVTLVRTQLVAAAGTPASPLQVTDDDVRARFDADPAAWAAQATTSTVRSLRVPVAADPPPACASALAAQPVRLPDVEAACGVPATEATLDGAVELPAGSPLSEAVTAVQGLAVGATSAPVVYDGEAHLHQLVATTSDPDAAFALYAERIRSVLTEERLDALLDDLLESAAIRTDPDLLSTIEAKD